jgi:hypothetical protein
MKRILSLSLCVLANAACPQDSKTETATDPSSTGGATETTSGATETTVTTGPTEASETTGATLTTLTTSASDTDTDSTETGATDTDATDTDATDTDATETSGGLEWPACVAPDPALTEGFEFDLSQWAPDFDFNDFEAYLEIEAACVVTSVTPQGVGTTAIELTCTEGPLVDVLVPFELTMPEDIALPFAPKDSVHLSYRAHSEDVDLLPGDRFAIRDQGDNRLLLAGFDDDLPIAWWSDLLAPMAVERVGGLCPCEGICDGEDVGTEREALRVSDGMGQQIEVLDRQRGTLASPGSPYEVVVRAAVKQFCLNCAGDYRALIVAAP